MPTNTAVNRSVNIYIESGEAEKAQQRLQKKWDDVSASLKKATDPTQVAKLNAELKKIEEPLDRANKKLNGQLKPSFTELTKTVNALGQRLKNLTEKDADFSKTLVQYQKANVQLQEMKGKMNSLQQGQNSFFSSAANGAKGFLEGAGIGAGIVALQALGQATSQLFSDSIDEALQAQRAAAGLKQSLEAAGRVEVFDRLTAKAQEFANKFKFIDNDDIVHVFDKLVTYGKLTENQMNKLIPVIVDFYSKQQLAGNSEFTLAEATSVVVKALEGNAKALKEYGINIKDAKNTTDRFGVVMDQLGAKVKGSADAFQNSLPGAIASSRQELKNMEEDLGNNLLPVWEKVKVGFLSGINGILVGLTNLKDGFMWLIGQGAPELSKSAAAIAKLKGDAIGFANAVAADDAKKSMDDQQRLLKAYIAQFNASQALHDKLKAENKLNTAEGQKALKNLETDAQVVLKVTASIKQQQDKTTLGINGGDAKGTKVENFFEKFKEQLRESLNEINAMNDGQFVKELAANQKKYDALNQQLKEALKQKHLTNEQYNKLVLESDDLRAREQDMIVQRELERIADNDTKLKQKLRANQAEYDKQREAENQRMYNKALDEQKNLVDQLTKLAGSQIGDKKAALELQALKNHGAAQLKAQKELLDLEEQQALAKTDLTENQIALIQEQYRQKKLQAELDYYNKIIGFLGQALQAFQSFAQAQTDRENADLARNDKLTDRKRRNYEGLYAKGLITRDEFDRKNAELDKQNDDKHKKIELEQFERNKKLSIAQAIINGLQGVTKTIADFGPPIPPNFIGIAAMALTLLTTGLQVGAIAKQKPPEFAKGGTFLSGPSHREGGMPIINPRTGRKVAEIEGGEVILSKRTVSNNPALVSSLLHNSMHRNGAALDPFWKNQPATYLNYSRLNKTLGRMRYFADGGVMPGKESGGSSQESDGAMMAVLMDLSNTVAGLKETLDRGIKAPINLSELEIQQQRIARIRADATAT